MKKRVVSFVAAVAALASLGLPALSRAAESATRTSSVGPVTVAVTPLPPAAPGEPLRLKVVLDTHSVDLDGVAFEAVVGVRSGGATVASPRVESTKGSGHHREAVLVFPSTVGAGASTLEVVVKDVGGVPERVFRWDLPLKTAGAGPAAQPQGSPRPGMGPMAGGGTADQGMGGPGMMMGQGPMGHGMMGMPSQMKGMMQQMGGMMQLLGEMTAAGQLTPEQTKRLGELVRQMGTMMADMPRPTRSPR